MRAQHVNDPVQEMRRSRALEQQYGSLEGAEPCDIVPMGEDRRSLEQGANPACRRNSASCCSVTSPPGYLRLSHPGGNELDDVPPDAPGYTGASLSPLRVAEVADPSICLVTPQPSLTGAMRLTPSLYPRILPLLAAVASAACSDAGDQYIVGRVEFNAPAGSRAHNLHATADGRVVLTWHEPTSNGRSALKLAVRDPAGTWGEPRTVVEEASFFVNWADFPSFLELPNGQWMVHWLQKTAPTSYAYHVKLAITGDQGATWGEPFSPHRDVSPTEHGFVSMVPWGDGAALLWLDGRAMQGDHEATEGDRNAGHEMPRGAMTIRFTTVDAAGTLGEETLLDARTCECCQTALVRTANGLVAAYRDRGENELRNIAITRFANGAWSEPAPVYDDGWIFPACPVNGPSLSANGDTVVIAWFTAPNEQRRVSVAFSTDGGATWDAPVQVDDGRPVGRVDIEMLADGSALVSWLEARQQGGEVLARRVQRSGRMSRPWVVARTSEERAAGFPRMARIGDNLIFAWVDATEGRVKVAEAKPAN